MANLCKNGLGKRPKSRFFFIFEKPVRCGKAWCLGSRFVVSVSDGKKLEKSSYSSCGLGMSRFLSYAEKRIDKRVPLEEILKKQKTNPKVRNLQKFTRKIQIKAERCLWIHFFVRSVKKLQFLIILITWKIQNPNIFTPEKNYFEIFQIWFF